MAVADGDPAVQIWGFLVSEQYDTGIPNHIAWSRFATPDSERGRRVPTPLSRLPRFLVAGMSYDNTQQNKANPSINRAARTAVEQPQVFVAGPLVGSRSTSTYINGDPAALGIKMGLVAPDWSDLPGWRWGAVWTDPTSWTWGPGGLFRIPVAPVEPGGGDHRGCTTGPPQPRSIKLTDLHHTEARERQPGPGTSPMPISVLAGCRFC